MVSINDPTSLWRQRFEEASASGMSTKAWCLAHGFSVHQYYYWKRRFQELDAIACVETLSNDPSARTHSICNSAPIGSQSTKPGWVRVAPSKTVSSPAARNLTIRISGAEIEVGLDFDPSLLRAVVAALGVQPC